MRKGTRPVTRGSEADRFGIWAWSCSVTASPREMTEPVRTSMIRVVNPVGSCGPAALSSAGSMDDRLAA